MWLTVVAGLAGLVVGFALSQLLRQRQATESGVLVAPDPPTVRDDDKNHLFPERAPVPPPPPSSTSPAGETSEPSPPLPAEPPTVPDPTEPTAPPATPFASPGVPGSTDEWNRLVDSCADLADRLRDRQPALYTVLTRSLAAVEVSLELADGEPFDAARHNPVGTEPTSDPRADQRVAETIRLGVLDHGSLVRVPKVIVYRYLEDGHVG